MRLPRTVAKSVAMSTAGVCPEVLLEHDGNACGQAAARAADGGRGDERVPEPVSLITSARDLQGSEPPLLKEDRTGPRQRVLVEQAGADQGVA